MSKKIETYQDLINSKKELKKEVILIEKEIKDSNIVQISNIIIGKKSIKSLKIDSIDIPHVNDIVSSPLGNLISTFLMSNKKIRKYFVAFAIIRETVPYIVTQVKKTINENS